MIERRTETEDTVLMHRIGNFIRRVFIPRAKFETEQTGPDPIETRPATETEIDEAIDESFPASDPPALHLEKDQ